MPLLGKERAIRALNFEEVDRPPMWGGWCENARFLESASGIRMKYGFTLNEWENPMRAALQAFKNVGVDVMSGIQLPKPPEMRSDPESPYGYMGWEVASAVERGYTPEKVVRYIEALPRPEDIRADFDFERQYAIYVNRMKRAQEECGEEVLWMSSASTVTFDGNFRLFGYEPYLIMCMRYREAAKKLNAYYAEQARCQNEVIAKAIKEEEIAPFCFVATDICYSHGPMLSPKVLDEIYFPYVKRAFEPLKNAGIKIIWHSDGYITPIVNSLIEAGVDGFQGFQEKYGVDFLGLMRMKARSGKPLILIGSIQVSTTLRFGTIETVKKDVERCIDLAMERGGGGYILGTDTNIGPDVPPENIFAMYEHGRAYGSRAYGRRER
ncbi:MAG: uroporphyrinogen decarboxylase family protein [Candidatus Bathyarchaeia archaeon]